MNFVETLVTPGRIYFGPGALGKLQGYVKELGVSRVLVVTDAGLQRSGLLEQVTRQLEAAGCEFTVFGDVEPDPDVATVDHCTAVLRSGQFGMVIGFGGGSSMDVAKCAAVCGDSGITLAEFRQRPPGPRRTWLVQIPTTAGSGSEATDRGVFNLGRTKDGFLSPHMVADAAIVDPLLTLSLPPFLTAATGMDTLTHAIEALTAPEANPLADAMALGVCQRVGSFLRRAVYRMEDLTARTEMARAALWGGMAFQNSNLGLVHALVLPVGGLYHVPHGIGCAILLPYVMEFNLSSDLEKFAAVAAALGENISGLSTRAAAEKAVDAVRQLSADIGIPSHLSAVGVGREAIAEMAQEAWGIQRLVKGNSRLARGPEELEAILTSAIG
jgi:alcohol dehydrogenase class IV